jgi:hypothetical protein
VVQIPSLLEVLAIAHSLTSPTAAQGAMALDPVLKRIISDPHVPHMPSAAMRWGTGLSCLTFVGAVIYAKWIEPRRIEEQIKRDMFKTPASH